MSASNGAVTIYASGEFDFAAVSDVRRSINDARRSPAALALRFDLTGVTFIDAAMLGALVTERQAVRAAGRDLVVTGVTPWTLRVIELCGLRDTLGL